MTGTEDILPQPIGYFKLIRQNQNFRYLWFGEVISNMGDWFNIVAVFALLLGLTNSAKAASWVIIIRMIPFFFMSPLAGVVCDRFDRKKIMIMSDLLRAIVVLALILVRRPDQMWIIYVVTLLEISLSAFFTPAKSAILPNIVKNQELITANALSSITWSVMLTLGAALGGLVSALFNHDMAFLINSWSFLFSALMIWMVKIPEKVQKTEDVHPGFGHPLRQFIDGIKYIFNKRDVLAYVLVKSGWGLSGGIILVITIFGQRIFPLAGSPDAGIGILYSARGLGTAVGPILARKMGGNSQKEMRDWIGYGFIIGGLFLIGFGLSTNLWLACLTLFLSHLGTSIMWVFSSTLLQLNTGDSIRGRVFSTEFAIFTLTMSISNYLTGRGLDISGLNPDIIVYLLGLTLFLPGLVWLSLLSRWDQWISKTRI